MAKKLGLKTLYTSYFSQDRTEGEEVVYLIHFCILIVSAFMKVVKHEDNVEH